MSNACLPCRACHATCLMPRVSCRTLRMESLRSASSALPSVVTHSACGHVGVWTRGCVTRVGNGRRKGQKWDG